MQEVKKEMSWPVATIIGLLLLVACSLHVCIQLLSEPCPHGAAFIVRPNEQRVKLDNRIMVTMCDGKVFAICSTLNSTCKLHYDVESVAEINEDLQLPTRGVCAHASMREPGLSECAPLLQRKNGDRQRDVHQPDRLHPRCGRTDRTPGRCDDPVFDDDVRCVFPLSRVCMCMCALYL